MITVDGLTVEFGGTTLFSDITFAINEKDRIALMGKNGAGKSTLLKITVPAVVPPDGTTASHPSTVAFSLETASPLPVDTLNPVEKSALFRPVQELKGKACTQERAGGSARCFTYTTAVYAEYQTAAETIVTITSSVTGKNSWTVFEPRSNEYHTDVSLSMNGEHHGWAVLDG